MNEAVRVDLSPLGDVAIEQDPLSGRSVDKGRYELAPWDLA